MRKYTGDKARKWSGSVRTPYRTDDTEYTGSQNNDDGRWDTFSDATGSGDAAIHKTAEGIAEAHDPDPFHAGINDGRFCGKQWQKLRTENKKQSTKDRACDEGICKADS